jgi:hypothetical protein
MNMRTLKTVISEAEFIIVGVLVFLAGYALGKILPREENQDEAE